MAIAINSQMTSNLGFEYQIGTVSQTSPQTFSFTNTAGTFLILFVSIASSSTFTITLGTHSYGGNALTKLTEVTTSGGATGGKMALYYMQSPPTGANTVSMAWTDNTTGGFNFRMCAGCISFTGVHTSSPFAQQTTGQSTGIDNPSISLSGVSLMTVAAMAHGETINAEPGSNTGTLAFRSDIDNSAALGNMRASTSTATGTVSRVLDTTNVDSYAGIMVELADAVTGTAEPYVSRRRRSNVLLQM